MIFDGYLEGQTVQRSAELQALKEVDHRQARDAWHSCCYSLSHGDVSIKKWDTSQNEIWFWWVRSILKLNDIFLGLKNGKSLTHAYFKQAPESRTLEHPLRWYIYADVHPGIASVYIYYICNRIYYCKYLLYITHGFIYIILYYMYLHIILHVYIYL